jgi:hypothetical protein
VGLIKFYVRDLFVEREEGKIKLNMDDDLTPVFHSKLPVI